MTGKCFDKSTKLQNTGHYAICQCYRIGWMDLDRTPAIIEKEHEPNSTCVSHDALSFGLTCCSGRSTYLDDQDGGARDRTWNQTGQFPRPPQNYLPCRPTLRSNRSSTRPETTGS